MIVQPHVTNGSFRQVHFCGFKSALTHPIDISSLCFKICQQSNWYIEMIIVSSRHNESIYTIQHITFILLLMALSSLIKHMRVQILRKTMQEEKSELVPYRQKLCKYTKIRISHSNCCVIYLRVFTRVNYTQKTQQVHILFSDI